MALAYIGLGANLGDAAATLRQAVAELSQTPGIAQLELSPLYRSAPVDSSGPDYINAVAALQTPMTARDLLHALQRVEQRHGRLRPYRNAPRTLDLDLLLYGTQEIQEPDLIVPHPRMHERAFVLRPLADLAPGLHLKQGPVADLLAACAGQALARIPG
ncbi:2-amino-4-hydroxy-6-hydroxymethyldihydropteridine diphosphokinase [Pollutimonas bauzanensis]|uniref:2-amino-4-hydroxy-6-hydroxymethyldihydropteridine pyrophosphokinase n=1 Tax=Pollutimonas bauzanensis TaxID=658167 RepID=A0A1M5YSE9_9BURK|nr:2-amino-4-hydroxy-6-hydroxymethyldihydropteridine diphosphokinase [Pollutimonas bauzanensis]SHI14962.1 2-amino-4-hydroxy-6-hydroxymethyldihydropteridinediphosphokinase [Pollutimonas bauzanensis]